MSEDVKKSAPPFNQQRVICPNCSYNNSMGSQHKSGDIVYCSNCQHEFEIG